MRIRVLLPSVAVLGLLACNGESSSKAEGDAKAKPRVVRGVDTKRIPVPNHGPDVMAGKVDKAVYPTVEGKFVAKFHDKPREFKHFSPGGNAAIYSEENKVGRITIEAAKDDTGYPRVEVTISHVRLDELELPVTFPLDKKAKKKVKAVGDEEPTFKIEYLEDGAHKWVMEPEETKAGENEVTLTKFEGRKLSGSLKARLHPRPEGMGEVVGIEHADFEVVLRLQGVKNAEPAVTPEG
jgi:hypothetical protein